MAGQLDAVLHALVNSEDPQIRRLIMRQSELKLFFSGQTDNAAKLAVTETEPPNDVRSGWLFRLAAQVRPLKL